MRRRSRSVKPDSEASRRRAGFTLVEVIVVIVIIAILAAIGVPALTGYIDKAQDKKYIAQARNIEIAKRTLLDEAYAEGKLSPDSMAGTYFEFGAGTSNGLIEWDMANLLGHIGKNMYTDIPALTGENLKPPAPYKYWDVWIYGPSGSTALTTDGFLYFVYPEGKEWGNPIILVTNRIKHYDIANNALENAFFSEFNKPNQFDPAAGYKVYHLVSQG